MDIEYGLSVRIDASQTAEDGSIMEYIHERYWHGSDD